MTLQSSGAISIANINTELGVASTTTRSLNDTVARTLAGVASGAISMSNFYGKSNRATVSYTYTTNTQNASLDVTGIGGYVSGNTTITVTVNSGIYLWSSGTGTPGFYITGRTGGDTLTLVNNGYIIGMGGQGAGSNSGTVVAAVGGGPALSLGCSLTIQNNGYIAGGGGGGGGNIPTGGGGAGGGRGGPAVMIYPASPVNVPGSAGGGAGGGIGGGGSNGSPFTYTSLYVYHATTGGGGGRILPGNATPSYVNTGYGSGAGGGGGNAGGPAVGTGPVVFPGGTGAGVVGAGGQAGGSGGAGYGQAYYGYSTGAAGGGGWGASGGAMPYGGVPGAAGGQCVISNGNAITWSATGTRYGAIA